ncbi:gluconate 2-dehydrogenase subunit 3 family protein [Arenibacter sp. GZD96]|uniref:gluconate 2-dehydrogenase subunit 3 family protein n=1 Tax=Aurantibrevibacter litoralis TaxID=3106030 RepID=UPI002AFF3F2B|nr:gluconate 2-dehydrogenase subunit 3 family protein [Arenibacter sp. GZD-96]MEA1784972.1 gluconate 2-dehydrogenase subunit 3 family protein [Arenibacter sp. GZD-96]
MNRRDALKNTGFLAGAAVALPTIFSLLESCTTENRLDWKPLFFTEIEAKTIAGVLDTILPRTETPGALDVKSDIFIDKVIAKTYDEAGQDKMRKDIAAFNTSCEQQYGNPFFLLKEADKINVLKTAEANSGKFNPGIWGTTVGEQEPIGFYRAIKSMGIWAYTTSEEIGKNVLSYDPIPGAYQPCIPLSDVGNRWSL